MSVETVPGVVNNRPASVFGLVAVSAMPYELSLYREAASKEIHRDSQLPATNVAKQKGSGPIPEMSERHRHYS